MAREASEGDGVRGSGLISFVFVAAMLAYGCWSAFSGHGRFTSLRVGYGPDSALYIAAAKAPVWSFAFLATPHGGPFLFLLLAKLCLRNLRAIVLVQSLIAAASWLFLAHTLSRMVTDPVVRLSAFVVILLVPLSPAVLLWNAIIATESLSISLLALAIALSLRVATGIGKGRRCFLLLVVVLVALAYTRDTNAYLLLFIGILAAVAAARAQLRLRAVVMASVCLLAAIAAIGLSNHAQRWYYPVSETISYRIIGSPVATTYFVAHGMPDEPQLRIAYDNDVGLPQALTSGPQYKAFRTWVLKHGRSTYTTFLATHPRWDLVKPFADRRRFLAPRLLPYGVTYDIEPQGPFRVAGAIGFPGSLALVEAWAIVSGLVLIALAHDRSRRRLVAVLFLIGGLAIVSFLLSWHGDALETDRHSLSAAVQMRILLWVVTALALDRVAHRIRSRVRTRHCVRS